MTSTEPTPETPATAAEPVVETPPPAAAVTDWEAEAKKWKDTSLKIEARANLNADAARKLKEIEDRDLSELDRLKRDNEELLTRANAAEKARLRADVALAKGIPPEVVGALVGDTAEELSAHAEALLAWRGSATPATPPAPRPDPGQGPQPISSDAVIDADYAAFQAHVFPNRK